jgi:pyruvate-formate lyase-activating enzyme
VWKKVGPLMFRTLTRRLRSACAPRARAPAPHLAGALEGLIDEISAQHAYGWACDRADMGRRLDCAAFNGATGERLGGALADQFSHGLAGRGVGDGTYAFFIRFSRPLSLEEQAAVVIRAGEAGSELRRSSALKQTYEPILHVAMDIVDNCNLRCPFCIYDYRDTHRTNFMTRETMAAALRFVPYTRDGEFWFSCLHEPAMHPDLMEYVNQVPPALRRKLFYTTNLAKRMPDAYFEWLANNGMHHINISIESRVPEIYERMRKGARFHIFRENWDKLVRVMDSAPKPTPIRYISMAYQSNFRELPALARYLIDERHASHVELRYTFDVPFIPPEFRAAEFLGAQDWAWLREQVALLPRGKVSLIEPPFDQLAEPQTAAPLAPSEVPAEASRVLLGRYMFRLSQDGSLRVVGVLDSSRGSEAHERVVLQTNVNNIEDPEAFLESLAIEAARSAV